MSNKEAWETATEGWRKGIESVHNQLQSLLKSYGVSEVNPLGQVFDPEIHEALTNVTVMEKEKHDTVVGVIQNGFVRTANGKTTSIRPARVTVGEFKDN
jgi:molecular chaperone GrpE